MLSNVRVGVVWVFPVNEGAVDELNVLLGDTVSQVMETIERHVQSFFVQTTPLKRMWN
ncbi:MAG: hypothetical protein ACYCTW_04145 [Sulfuricella sp.]